MGIDDDFPNALYKAMVASGVDVPEQGRLLVTIADRDKDEALEIVRGFAEIGFTLFATKGTARFLKDHGVKAQSVKKIREGHPNILDLVSGHGVDLVVNTLSPERTQEREGARIRRASVERNIPCLTSLDTARALLMALSKRRDGGAPMCQPIDRYLSA
jgi:carbamoyl-phosphate synthase large subunit